MKTIQEIKDFIDNNSFSESILYIIGGAALYLHDYVSNYPNDVDILIPNGDWYNQKTSGIDIDCVEIRKALLAEGWEDRALLYQEYSGVVIKFLSFEDIIINRTSGLHYKKHYDYVVDMVKQADLLLLKQMINNCKSQSFLYVRDEVYRNNLSKLELLIG